LSFVVLTLPFSGLAVAATTGHGDMQTMGDMPCHSQESQDMDTKGATDGSSCDRAHACCAVALPPVPALATSIPAPTLPIASGEVSFTGFVPDHLDPPPLAL
jgi:hypothetical protein